MKHLFFARVLHSAIGKSLIGLAFSALITHPVYAQDPGSFAPESGALSATRNGTSAHTEKRLPATRNLGYLVNSRFDDLNPIVTADGSTIYFARKYSIENTGGRTDAQDIWTTTLVDGQWTTSRNLGPEVNTAKADNLCAVSADQKTLYFFVQTAKQKGYFGFRQKLGSGWTKMQSTGLEIQNESHFLEASMAMNGTAFLFTARNPRNLYYRAGIDERDIFISLRLGDESWSDPINLGPAINSARDEYSPFLAADGKTLYFSSNGRSGMGGADIFMARRTGSGWTEWTEPVNLGPQINSAGFDGYLTIPASGDVAYLASSRLSLGKADLVKVTLPVNLRPEKVIQINGFLRNAETGHELVGNVSITIRGANGTTMQKFGVSGAYTAFVATGTEVTIEANADRFLRQRRSLHTSPELSAISLDFALHPVVAGIELDLNPIYFKEGKADLTPSALLTLDSLSTLLRENPLFILRVEGHTDNRGHSKSLYELSRKRVHTVHNYLIRVGIAPKRISVKALGPSFPATDNATDEGRSMNRRVEFRVVRQ